MRLYLVSRRIRTHRVQINRSVGAFLGTLRVCARALSAIMIHCEINNTKTRFFITSREINRRREVNEITAVNQHYGERSPTRIRTGLHNSHLNNNHPSARGIESQARSLIELPAGLTLGDLVHLTSHFGKFIRRRKVVAIPAGW